MDGIHIYIYIYIYAHMYIYVYIYIGKIYSRGRGRWEGGTWRAVCTDSKRGSVPMYSGVPQDADSNSFFCFWAQRPKSVSLMLKAPAPSTVCESKTFSNFKSRCAMSLAKGNTGVSTGKPSPGTRAACMQPSNATASVGQRRHPERHAMLDNHS